MDVVRAFAASQLDASTLAVTGPGASATLAAAAAAVLPAPSLEIAPDAAPVDCRQTVTTSRELWPLQYLVRGGAYISVPHGTRPNDT